MKPLLPPVQSTLEALLQNLGVSYERIIIKSSSIPGHVTYEIQTPDHALLIGREGKNLQALNTLVRSMLEVKAARGNDARLRHEEFVIDINDYQEKKLSDLITYVKDKINEAKSTSEPVSLRPMPAFHRLIAHSLAQEHGLQSNSEGEGRERHLVIKASQN